MRGGIGLHVNYLHDNSRYEEMTWKSNTNFIAIKKKRNEILKFVQS